MMAKWAEQTTDAERIQALNLRVQQLEGEMANLIVWAEKATKLLGKLVVLHD